VVDCQNSDHTVDSMVARWYIFIPKIPILEVLGMENVGAFNGHLENFTVIWNILRSFVIFYCHLVHFAVVWYVCLTNKNLATLSD
jgi:ferric iron reductase protein FhuF